MIVFWVLGQFLQYLKKKDRGFIRRPETRDVNWHLLKGDKYFGSPSKLNLACSQAAIDKGLCSVKIVGECISTTITDLTSGSSFDFTFTIGPELDNNFCQALVPQ